MNIEYTRQKCRLISYYADASSGYGAALFQLKRFFFAETQKTTYCYLSATLYALKDNGYVPLSGMDTTLVIPGVPDLYPVLEKAANDAIDNFIARGILSTPADSVVYSYNDVQHIDSVKKRRIKVYNTSTYAEGFLPEANIAEVIGAVDRLEDLGSIRRLMDLLRVAPRAMAAAE